MVPDGKGDKERLGNDERETDESKDKKTYEKGER